MARRREPTRVQAMVGIVPTTVALLAAIPSAADASPSGVLTIRVSHLRSNRGQIGCAIYSSAKGYPTDSSAALQRRWCPINGATSTCAFDSLSAGTYAIACIHDENGNGTLDLGLFGIPKEGTVASNQAKGFMGPPSFDKAKFWFSGAATDLSLRMTY